MNKKLSNLPAIGYLYGVDYVQAGLSQALKTPWRQQLLAGITLLLIYSVPGIINH